ncbi:MAG: Lrp/AsnC family transcriptional regulator [Thermoplasmataceae archaeon]
MQDKPDEKDMQILRYLVDHGRDKISEISSNLGIPRATIFERLEKLKKNNFIKRFTVDLDYDKLGYTIMSYVLIEFDFSSNTTQQKLCAELSKLDNVVLASIISGRWDIIILVIAKNMKELADFVLEKLQSIEGVSRTYSIPIYEHMKP